MQWGATNHTLKGLRRSKSTSHKVLENYWEFVWQIIVHVVKLTCLGGEWYFGIWKNKSSHNQLPTFSGFAIALEPLATTAVTTQTGSQLHWRKRTLKKSEPQLPSALLGSFPHALLCPLPPPSLSDIKWELSCNSFYLLRSTDQYHHQLCATNNVKSHKTVEFSLYKFRNKESAYYAVHLICACA